MKILLTGFTPFGGETVNSSYEAVKRLPDTVGGAEIIKLEIPTVFTKSVQAVEAAVAQHRPDAVISVGQAAGRRCVTVEKVAINYADAGIADNEGDLRSSEPLLPDGPDAYFSTLPVKAMIQNVRDHGLRCELSLSADAYVCNCVMYHTLHLAKTQYPGMLAGFIHVPCADCQLVGKNSACASMPLESITAALRYAVEAAADELASKSSLSTSLK